MWQDCRNTYVRATLADYDNSFKISILILNEVSRLADVHCLLCDQS